MNAIQFIYKSVIVIKNKLSKLYSYFFTLIEFFGNGVIFSSFKTNGIPYVMVAKEGSFYIGKNFKMNNDLTGNPIGRPQKCTFVVDNGAKLYIGNNVGVSSTAIVCHNSIIIEDDVKIGGGVCIYDTDFHALESLKRENSKKDRLNKVNKPVKIKKNAFIGAHSTILKGVIIGESSIVGACSVVTKNIPKNEIWGGNPAKFLRKL